MDNNWNRAIGAVIFAVRTGRHESAREMAERWTNVSGRHRSQGTVSAIENGDRAVSVSDLLELALCLDMSPTGVLTFALRLEAPLVAGKQVDLGNFNDWLFENRCLPGQDPERFRELATVNLVKIGGVWSFVGDVYLDFTLAVYYLDAAVAQKDVVMIRDAASIVRSRLEALEYGMATNSARDSE